MFSWFPSYFYMFDFTEFFESDAGQVKITLKHYFSPRGYGIMTTAVNPTTFITVDSLSRNARPDGTEIDQ